MSDGPTELAWDTPISELITTVYDLGPELIANPPRLLVHGARVQADWASSGLEEPEAATLIDISFSARPVAPATIKVHQAPTQGAPAVETLEPSTAPAGIDLSLTISGTGFDAGATVNISDAYGLVPDSVSDTSLSVTVKALNILLPGTLEASVTNGDRQTSNALPLTLT